MNRSPFLLIVILAITACSGVNDAPENVHVQPAITNGDVDHAKRYPHVGAFIRIHNDGEPRQICTGTLIHPRVFLTAGHCTDYVLSAGLSVERIKVNFDLYALNKSTLLDVERVVTHPGYGSPGWKANMYDVGALILERPVTNVKPAVLAPLGFLDQLRASGKLREGSKGAKFTAVGYGVQEWESPGFSWDGLRRVGASEFLNLRNAWLQLLMTWATGNDGTCYGDSGGPHFWTNNDGTEVIVSVTSWGDARCVATDTTYRVDIPESREFIDGILQSLP